MGTQPKRVSPAQQQADAERELRLLTFEMRQAMARSAVKSSKLDDIIRGGLLELLHRGRIKIVERSTGDPPMEGQATLDE
jgi:hypothetical protein